VTGKKFADNFTALIEAGPLGEGIAVTETGACTLRTYVATNTASPGGISLQPEHAALARRETAHFGGALMTSARENQRKPRDTRRRPRLKPATGLRHAPGLRLAPVRGPASPQGASDGP
jgi:hypothetical protein